MPGRERCDRASKRIADLGDRALPGDHEIVDQCAKLARDAPSKSSGGATPP